MDVVLGRGNFFVCSLRWIFYCFGFWSFVSPGRELILLGIGPRRELMLRRMGRIVLRGRTREEGREGTWAMLGNRLQGRVELVLWLRRVLEMGLGRGIMFN